MVQDDNIISDDYINAHRLSIGKQKSSYIRNIDNRLDTKITKNETKLKMRNFITGKVTTKVTRNSKLLIRLEALALRRCLEMS